MVYSRSWSFRTQQTRGRMADEIYFRSREAAEYLKTSTSTLAKRRLYGGGPKFSRIGRSIRYAQSELDRFMAANTVSSTFEQGAAMSGHVRKAGKAPIDNSSARELLVKTLGMLASDQAAERDSAARFAERFRAKLGVTWDELISRKRR